MAGFDFILRTHHNFVSGADLHHTHDGQTPDRANGGIGICGYYADCQSRLQDSGIPLFSGLVPILTVLGLELVLSGLMLRSIAVRRLLCGRPVILIENGKILQSNLRATRVTIDELMGHLRLKDVLDIKTVQYAILETDGDLSVFPYPADCPASAKEAGISAKRQHLPVTIVEDGFLFRDDLKKAGKNEAWLRKVLLQHDARLEDTFLLTVDASDHIVWLGKEESP